MPVLERERLNLQLTLNDYKSSDAFRLERYRAPINKDSLRDDIVSYLGEYRFGLPKYSYELRFENDHLLDPHKKVSLENMTDESLKTRLLERKSTYREAAERQGVQMLDRKLTHAKKGDTIIWMSPPGEKSEGYGDYGFVFYGKVGEGNFEKNISMTAIRVEGRDLEKYSKAFKMITNTDVSHLNPEQFIANPQVLNDDVPEGYVDAVLGLTLGFKPSNEAQEKFKNIIRTLGPLIEHFIGLSDISEKQKAFYALENYTLELKNASVKVSYTIDKGPEQFGEIVDQYGYKPPKAAGSCGSTGKDNSITSSNIFNKLSSINNFLSNSEQEWFNCPKCKYQADGPIGNQCPGCGLTKEDYAEESGVSCD